MTKQDKFEKLLNDYEELFEIIRQTIGYNNYIESILDTYWIDDFYEINGTQLTIIDRNDQNCFYGFTISSYSSKGEELYKGTLGQYEIVMIHDEERWENTTIIILKTTNKIKSYVEKNN